MNVKISVAIIGRSVNAKKPMIHGEMKISAQRASRREMGERRRRRRGSVGVVSAGDAFNAPGVEGGAGAWSQRRPMP